MNRDEKIFSINDLSKIGLYDKNRLECLIARHQLQKLSGSSTIGNLIHDIRPHAFYFHHQSGSTTIGLTDPDVIRHMNSSGRNFEFYKWDGDRLEWRRWVEKTVWDWAD